MRSLPQPIAEFLSGRRFADAHRCIQARLGFRGRVAR
jgi:hypothetical protein